ncbi:hypothetical protein NPIL_449841 [Nephila pilipes]|uniref:Uncharacterized protein n=1 Tax=Nephila pilipes TaxID=299642 RepID=A0A8X6NT33_NEPPI|nr:hypothetical protein NPIL_449841 [Nephila pilipes]
MSKDLSKLKNKRTARRSMLTKLINKIEGTINRENKTVDWFEVFLEQLIEKGSYLNALNIKIEDILTVHTIFEGMESPEEIKDQFMENKTFFEMKKMISNSIKVDAVS